MGDVGLFSHASVAQLQPFFWEKKRWRKKRKSDHAFGVLSNRLLFRQRFSYQEKGC
jgi:hypothetical protein